MVPGTSAKLDQLWDETVFETLLGEKETLEVSLEDDGVTIKSPGGPTAKIVAADILACSAVLHKIDTVLIPSPKFNSLG